MEKNNNAASRLYRLLEQGASLPDNTATLKAWASVFRMEEPYGVQLSIDVSERLLWLNQELEILEQQLAAFKPEDANRAEALIHIGQALSPVYLPTNWDNVKQFLAAETLNSLANWIEILSEDERSIQQEELEAIRVQTQELEPLLGSSTLDEKLKLLVSRQVKSIRKALDGYSIIGTRALKAAAFSALGELIYIEPTLKSHCDKPEVRKLIDVWGKISELADQALPVEGDIAGEEGRGVKKNPWTALCPHSA